MKNEAILRDFLFFKVDNIKNKAILRDVLQKWKVECRADGLVPISFAIFPIHLSKLLRLPPKSDARSYEVLHLSRKIISANLKIWGSKMQPLSENQRPDLTALMDMSLVLRLPRKMHLCRSSSHACHCFWKCYKTLTFCPLLTRSTIPCARHAKRHLNVQKWREHLVFLTCASRHNGVHFFDISTSKSGPNLVCFVHFDFEMCFAPQRRALFRHRNFQKWSKHGVFCTFWFRHVLRTTTACTFSTSQLPKVVQTWCVLYILTSKCASRQNGVQCFISHLASWLRTRRFSEPTFRPSGDTKIIGKTQCFATFLPIRAPASSFFWLFLFSYSSLFCSSLLYSSAPPLLFICPYCRKFDF